MRKKFPLIVLIFSFSFFLFLQIAVDSTNLIAKEENSTKKINNKYEDIYKNLDFEFSSTKKVIKSNEIVQPLVILNFWASWCFPCVKEFAGLNKLIESLGQDKIRVVGINNDYDDQVKKIALMQEKHSLKFQSVVDQGKYTSLFGVEQIPFTLIFFKGKLVKVSEGEFDFSNSEFVKEMQKLFQ